MRKFICTTLYVTILCKTLPASLMLSLGGMGGGDEGAAPASSDIYVETLADFGQKPPDTQLIALNKRGSALFSSDQKQRFSIALGSRIVHFDFSVLYNTSAAKYSTKLAKRKAVRSGLLMGQIPPHQLFKSLSLYGTWQELLLELLDFSLLLKQQGDITKTIEELIDTKNDLEQSISTIRKTLEVCTKTGRSASSGAERLMGQAASLTLEKLKVIQELQKIKRAIFNFLSTKQFNVAMILPFGSYHLMGSQIPKRRLGRYQTYGVLALKVSSNDLRVLKLLPSAEGLVTQQSSSVLLPAKAKKPEAKTGASTSSTASSLAKVPPVTSARAMRKRSAFAGPEAHIFLHAEITTLEQLTNIIAGLWQAYLTNVAKPNIFCESARPAVL